MMSNTIIGMYLQKKKRLEVHQLDTEINYTMSITKMDTK